MYKKSILCILLLFFVCSGFSQTQFYYFYTDKFYNDEVYVTPDSIYFIGVDYNEYSILPLSLFKLNDNGFLYYDNEIVLLDNLTNALVISEQRKEYIRLLDFYDKLKRNVEERYLHYYYSNRSLKGETRYKASSELSEKTKNGLVIYEADNLGKFAFDKTEQIGDLYFNFNHKPWVEGVSGNGIGESIHLSCDTEFNSIAILNGYIDFDKLHLYKNNSRVKKFKVLDEDNNVEYFALLDDEVKFQFIYFEKPTKKVKLIIEEVYEGSKWDDTCITGLIPSNYKVKSESFDFKNQKQENAINLSKELSKSLKNKVLKKE